MENKGITAREVTAREVRTYLDVSHEGKTLTFVYPMAGPGTYAEVGKQIDSQGLARPTFVQIVSLVHSAWQNPENKYSKEIIQTLKDGCFWGFNGILYVPNEGAYIQDVPKVVNGSVSMDKSDLVKRLEANDPSVRFAEFGFETGEHLSARDLANNEFVIGLVGKEGAYKLAEIAGKYSNNPHVWNFKNVDNKKISVPALCQGFSGWGKFLFLRGDRLDIQCGSHCNWNDSYWGGHALGVFETKKLA